MRLAGHVLAALQGSAGVSSRGLSCQRDGSSWAARARALGDTAGSIPPYYRVPDFTLHEGLGPKSGTGSYQKDKKDGRGGRGRSASGVSGSGVIDIGWWEFERMETLRGQLMEIQTAHGAPAESKGGERAAPFRDDGDD